MRIAYLINVYPAGSHTFIRREISALERLGFSVDRIALRGWSGDLPDVQDRTERERTRYVLRGGVWTLMISLLLAIVQMPMRVAHATLMAFRMSRGSEKPLLVHIAYLAEACVVRRWARVAGCTHLHAHFATNPAEIAMLVRALGGPPYSFTAHGSDINDRPAQIGLPMTVQDASFVIAVCSFGRAQLFKWLAPSLWDRVQVVRCSLPAGYGAASAPPMPTSRRLLCIGRLSKEKGQLLLLHAARAVIDSGVEFTLVLVGDGPMRTAIGALSEQLSLGAHLVLTGWLDSDGIADQLERSRALVVPSLSEGLPIVIIEAMSSGRPVVAPYLAGIPELVKDGHNGWLFPAGDIAALASAMRACLLTSGDELLVISNAARVDALRAHDVDVEIGRLAALFRHSSLTASPVRDRKRA